MDSTPEANATLECSVAAVPSSARLLVILLLAMAGLLVVGWLAWHTPAVAQSGQQIPPSLVILARSDVPADALASGPVGGMLGAPVLLTPSTRLHEATAEALTAMAPDVVVLAGGEAALSPDVEQAVADLGLAVRRAAGVDRHETAVLVSALLAEFNTGRPVLTGTPVADHMIPGLDAQFLQGMTPDDLVGENLHSRIDALEATVAGQDDRIDDLETTNAGLTQRVADLEALLAGVTRPDATTLQFEGMNVQIANGTGTTDGAPNGLGNLVIGYNAQRPTSAGRTGSHYLVVGDQHEWTSHTGIVAGWRNTVSGVRASVTGGENNTASGSRASVTGGFNNTASGDGASITGGLQNTASGSGASVTGGAGNAASLFFSSVTGGLQNTASGDGASVTGGRDNTANNSYAAVTGGRANTASGTEASVSGGQSNVANGLQAWIGGGKLNTASGEESSVSGGHQNDAAGTRASILGGLMQEVLSGTFNTCHPSCA